MQCPRQPHPAFHLHPFNPAVRHLLTLTQPWHCHLSPHQQAHVHQPLSPLHLLPAGSTLGIHTQDPHLESTLRVHTKVHIQESPAPPRLGTLPLVPSWVGHHPPSLPRRGVPLSAIPCHPAQGAQAPIAAVPMASAPRTAALMSNTSTERAPAAHCPACWVRPSEGPRG